MPARGYRKPIEYEVSASGCFECTSHCINASGHVILGWRRTYGESAQAHRFIYEECFGEIPEGQVVRHKCDNPKCINPEHLELGTQYDNIQDMVDRGRFKSNSGTDNPRAVLNEEIVKAIRLDSNRTYQSWADEFGLDKSTIYKIKKYIIWKDVVV